MYYVYSMHIHGNDLLFVKEKQTTAEYITCSSSAQWHLYLFFIKLFFLWHSFQFCFVLLSLVCCCTIKIYVWNWKWWNFRYIRHIVFIMSFSFTLQIYDVIGLCVILEPFIVCACTVYECMYVWVGDYAFTSALWMLYLQQKQSNFSNNNEIVSRRTIQYKIELLYAIFFCFFIVASLLWTARTLPECILFILNISISVSH